MKTKNNNGRFTRVCAYCGVEFKTESPKARFCCNAHKQAQYRERKKRLNVTTNRNGERVK